MRAGTPGTLTDLTVRNITAKSGVRVEVWDTKLPGFGLRVSPKGTKTFVLLYRKGGRKHRLTLGRFPFISLAEARAKALGALARVKAGEEPEPNPPRLARVRTFEAAVEEFVEKHCARHNRKNTAYETERLLRARFCSRWAKREITEITRSDVIAVLDAAVKAGTPIAANHALAAVRKLFNWCVERGIVETSPCQGISRPSPAVTRERVLDDDELASLWAACEQVDYPLGAITKLLILTAQRRGEVTGMRRNEIDMESAVWSLPGSRTKNGRVHVLPLSPLAVSVLGSLPRINEELVFPARGSETEPVSGFSKLKPKLEALTNVTDWTLHDLRRTAATGMARLGVPPHVVERILNHVSGTFAGVAGIYNRFEYLPEMREALEAWAAHVACIVKERERRSTEQTPPK